MSLLKPWVPAKDYCKHLARCSPLAPTLGVGVGSCSSPRRVAVLMFTLRKKLLTGNTPSRGNAAKTCTPETPGIFWFSQDSYQGGVKGLLAHLLGTETAVPRPVKSHAVGLRRDTVPHDGQRKDSICVVPGIKTKTRP